MNTSFIYQNQSYTSQTDEKSSRQSYLDYFHPKFPKFLTIIFLIIGNSGNILSLFVFCKSSMRKNSVFTYFAFLSIVDFFVITLGLGDLIMITYFSIVLRNESILLCRIHTFLTYVFTHLSSFILASVSLDRAIALNSIKLSKWFCKPKTACKVIIINCTVVVLINFHSLIFLGIEQIDEFGEKMLMCAASEGTLYYLFLEPYAKYIDLICYAIAPFAIMLVCTLLIVRVLIKSTKSFKKHHNNSANRSKHKKNESRKKNITFSLIILNFLFLCLVSPLVVVLVFLENDYIQNQYLTNTVYLLAYSNHCFNFIFYGISCPPYRKVLLSFFKKKKANNVHR